jgi:hypothetical protein
MEEERLRMSEDRVLRKILGPQREEVIRGWQNCIRRSTTISCLHQILLKGSNRGRQMEHAACMKDEKQVSNISMQILWRYNLGHKDVDRRMILKYTLKK